MKRLTVAQAHKIAREAATTHNAVTAIMARDEAALPGHVNPDSAYPMECVSIATSDWTVYPWLCRDGNCRTCDQAS